MATIRGDIETISTRSIKQCGAHNFIRDPSTDILCISFVIDDEVAPQTWQLGDPVPECFTDPANTIEWWNWFFDTDAYAEIAVKRHGFPPIPAERQNCAQRVALANGYPAELETCCRALDIPYRKDKAAADALRRLNSPPPKRKRVTVIDPLVRENDKKLVIERCKVDVLMLRAVATHPRIRPLLPDERRLLLVDAEVGARGVCANIQFLTAGYALAKQSQIAAGERLRELTGGAVTTINQRDKIIAAVNTHGHRMTKLDKRAVATVLTHKPNSIVREILELRRDNARNSILKFKKFLAVADPVDDRLHGALRFCGAHTGRWTSSPQLHNLNRNDAELPRSLVAALLANDIAELRRFGNPLHVIAQLGRAVLCAAPGHELLCADWSNIEGRVLMWFANEEWELETFRQYDATGDKNLDPYRIVAHRMLKKNSPASDITAAERQLGKFASLALGYGGSIGAWRNIAKDEDVRSDAEVLAIVYAWRDAHPKVRNFWKQLARITRSAIRTGRPATVTSATGATVTADYDGYALTLQLPSGRKLTYPGARLVPNGKIADGDPDIEYFDNSKGGWRYKRAWFGVLAENVVSATARDLLAAAILRAHARGYQIVHHSHDELVIEAPKGTIPEQDVLAVMLEAPPWAAGLPLHSKIHVGQLYLEAPATGEPKPELVTMYANLDDTDDDAEADGDADADIAISDAEIVLPNTDTAVPDGTVNLTACEAIDSVVIAMAATDALHICAQCRRTPPDGTEHAIADGIWLHPRCETAYVETRIAEEGIAWRRPHCQAAALTYAARGWRTFPAPPGGAKKSLKSAEHSNGRKWGNTTDPAEIERDYRRWPNANCGIVTGRESGVWVIETDTPEGHGVDGEASLHALELQYGALPPTLTSRSPSGSLHRYFRTPATGAGIKNSTSALAPGVDVRGDGGMVLAPPSRRDGGAYIWVNNLPPADAPPWLTERAQRQQVETGNDAPSENLTADALEVAAAVDAIPNPLDLGWHGWNRVGMAIYAATSGSEEGFAIFDRFSRRWEGKYDTAATRACWDKYHSCPPDRLGAGTLFYLAREAGWQAQAMADALNPNIETVRDAFDPGTGGANKGNGHAQPEPRPDDPPADNATGGDQTKPAAPYVLCNLSTVQITAPRWLWRGHLPIGALELNAGGLGLGKGLVACDFAARVSNGNGWPDGAPSAEPGSVIVLTAEDRTQDYARRLAAAGADRSKINVLEYVRRNGRNELFLLAEDLDKLAMACLDLGDVRLVIIDPITAYMGSGKGFDSHRATDVRAQLHPLKEAAEVLNITFSAITHPPKGASTRAVVDNFIGSQAYLAAARVGHFCVEELGEEDDRGFRRPTGRVLYTMARRPSHSEPMPTLAFRQEIVCVGSDPKTGESINVPRIVWEAAPIDLTADEAMKLNRPKEHGDGRKARAAPVREFLRDTLANGPVLRETVLERGTTEGFTEQQLRRAREAVGVVAYRQSGVEFGARRTFWCLRGHAPADADLTDGD